MAENFGVLLEAKLDEIKSGKTIEAQLKSMGQRIDSLPIGFNIDIPSVTKQFNGLVKVLESHIGQAGDALNEVFSTTRILKYKDTLGSTVKDYQKLNQETGKFETQNRTITEDAEKQKNILEEQSKIYQKIKSTLDSLPEQFKGTTITQDLYSMLDTSNSLDDLKALQNITDNYYKEITALEKQYQSVKKSTNKDTIEAFKQEESKVNFIYQKRKQLLDLERQIAILSTTKGINTGNYTPEIENLRSVLGGLSTTGESLYDNQRSEINQIIDSLKQKLALEKDSLNIQKLQEEAQIKINNARQNLNDIITKNGKYDENQYQKLNNDLNTLESNLKSGAISTQDFNLEMKKLTPEMKQFETEARKASASTSTLSSRFKRFLSFYSFYDVLSLGKRLIREVANEIKLLDDSILEVNKILNLSTDEMDKFVKKAYEMGESVSRTGRDAVDAVGTMVKAGFSNLDEAMDFAQLSLSMKNVGDNMNDVERNANVLISTMKGFGDESVQFAEKTLNVLNEVSNTSAITFSDLAEAYTRTSAVYHMAGVSIEELAGLVTGANEIIQNIEKSSSGLLIITQRIQGVTEAFEEDPENLSQVDKALKQIAGIDIRDANGQLRDTYEILNDISKVYGNLDSIDRNALSEIVSGKRQRSVFEALMANWNKVEKVTQSAMNSQDSYMKEQEAYFNSISGHLARLESAWQSLATSSMDSDFVKSLIDTVTWIVKLTDVCGGLQVVLLGLIASFISFKAVLNIDVLKNVVSQMTLLAKTTEIAGKSVTTLSLAGKLLIGAGVVAGVMAIGYGINYLATQSERAEKQVKTLSDNLKELSKTNNNTKNLSNNFEKLSNTLDKTPEQVQELIDTQNQLKELLPNLKGYYDELGNFNIETDKEKSNLSDLVDLQQQSLESERERLNLASKRVIDYSINDYEKESKRLKQLIELQELNKKRSEEGLSRQEQQRRINLNNILGVSAGGSLSKEIEKVRSDIDKSLTDISDKFINTISTTKEWSKLTKDQANAVRKAFSELDEKSLILFTENIRDGKINNEDFIKSILKSPSAIKYLEEALNNANNKIDETTESINTLEKSIELLSATRSDIESLQKVLTNLDEGNLTAEDMEQLLSISEEFLPYLNDEIALREKLTQTIDDSKNAYKSTYEYMILLSSNTYSELSTKIEKYFNGLGIAYSDDLKNYKDLETAKAVISNNLIKELSRRWGEYFSVGLNGIVQVDDSNANVSSRVLANQYKEAQSYVDGFYNLFNDIEIDPIDINFDTSSLKSSADKAISEVDRLKQELEKRLQDNEFKLSLLEFSGGEDTLTKQIAVYQQMQDEVHKLTQKYRSMGLSENDDYIQQLRTQWIDYANSIAELESVSFDNSNKSIDRTITQLELEQQLLKENSQEYINIENKKYDEIVKREQLLQNEISRLQAIGTNSAKQQAEEYIDLYYDTVSQRNSIIANLQSSQISLFENQIEELEKQKSALEDLHDFTMQMIKDELNAKKESIQEEIKGIEKVFNARKQALKDEQDTRNYEKGLTKKSSVVADLENQLALIKNDETAIAKRKALEEDLVKAKEDLANYQYDHSIELAERALDEELEIRKSTLEEEIEELDDTLSNEVTMRELANKRIEKSGEKLKNQLIKHAKEYGTFTIEEVSNAWELAGEAVDDFNLKQLDLLDTLKLVSEELIKTKERLKEIENLSTGEYGSKIGANTSTINREQTIAKMQSNSEQWSQADPQKKQQLAEENQKLGKALGLTYDSSTGIWYYDKQKKLRVYHEGGVVGGTSYATKSTEELAKLLKGELVITPPQADKVMDMITNNNNSESFNPTFVFQFEGSADNSLLEQFKKEAKTFANIVAEEMNKSRSNTGYKKKLKRA